MLGVTLILERDPLGDKYSVEIERVWMLAVIDVAMHGAVDRSKGY